MSNEQIQMTFESDMNKEDGQYPEWKKVSEYGKFRWRKVITTKKKDDFRERFMKDVDEFMDHVFRVKTQYTEMKRLRENLPK